MEFQKLTKIDDVKGEWFEPGSSETEEGQSVSVKSIYERCLRGEIVPAGKEFYYEKEVGIMEHPDSDIADVTAVEDYLSSKYSTDGKSDEGSKDGAAPSKASDGREKSEEDDVKEPSKDG